MKVLFDQCTPVPLRRYLHPKEGMNDHLAHEPMKVSRSRIKRLREMEHPEYRLRLDPYRVFYDVIGQTVVVLAIVPKDETAEWLDAYGVKTT